jgi:outer membrane protein assembly factor BamB
LILTATAFQLFTAQTNSDSQSIRSPRLEWTWQRGVTRYRLQIAADKKFRDVRLDRLVTGTQFKPTSLQPGRYYFRVAPAQFSTGPFLKPVAFQVQIVADAFTPVSQAASSASGFPRLINLRNRGWMTATGALNQLIGVSSKSSPIVVGVSSTNVVFAIDAGTGVTRWINRESATERIHESFEPLTIATRDSQLVVNAYSDHVRALDSETGRKVWTTKLVGMANAGVVNDVPEVGPTVYLVDYKSNTLFILDGLTGKEQHQERLRIRAQAPPVLLPNVGVLIPTENSIELHGLDGSFVRTVELKYPMTTSPLAVETSQGWFLLFGTRNGLSILDSSLNEVARLPLEGDYPVGPLIVSDMDQDKSEVVTSVTKNGRVLAVDLRLQKLKWLSKSVTTSDAKFDVADVDADRRMDVLIPGRDQTLLALSGFDGSVIWRSDAKFVAPGVVLVCTPLADGRTLLTFNEPQGLRTIELQQD